ncbi:MAG: hypothetical protein V3V56_09770 [bacterium]
MSAGFVLTVLVAGFMATYAHLIFAITADKVGLAKLDFGKGVSMLLFGDSYGGSPPYMLGLAVVHLNGMLFALIYAGLIGPQLAYSPLVRGLIFSGMLLIFSQCIFNPIIARNGFFSVKIHPRAWQTAIVAHAIYGAILGWLSPVL